MKEKKLKEIERQSENASHKQSNWSRDFDFFQAFSIVNIFTAFMATIINITSQRKINLFQRDDRLVLIDRLIELFSAHIHEKMISRIKKKNKQRWPGHIRTVDNLFIDLSSLRRGESVFQQNDPISSRLNRFCFVLRPKRKFFFNISIKDRLLAQSEQSSETHIKRIGD